LISGYGSSIKAKWGYNIKTTAFTCSRSTIDFFSGTGKGQLPQSPAHREVGSIKKDEIG
jgi:hypothetical protein